MAKPQAIYFGTYTRTSGEGIHSKGIYRSLLDDETGVLSVPQLVAEATNPSFLAFSPNGRFLYAAMQAKGDTGNYSAVGAWAVGADGQLTPLNHQPSGGGGACHVWVDATGQNVLAANYGGGSIACFRVRPDGSLGERSAFVQHTGSGPNPRRQDKPHAHSIYTDPTNTLVYVCDLGTDQVNLYDFDAAAGTLKPHVPAFASAPMGGGPRHLAQHPQHHDWIYVNNELGLSVTFFKKDASTGALNPVETVPTLSPETPTEGASTAEIWIHPSGNWLYVSNRGANTITTYAIGADGKLTGMKHLPTPAQPRGFGISPDGRWLVVAGQKDDRVATFRIDAATGQLQEIGSRVQVGAGVCVLFAPPESAPK